MQGKDIHKKSILLCFAVLVLMVIWVVWSNTALVATHVEVSSSRLPAEFSGFRIAHVSDLHNAELGENNEDLLRMISEAHPDIIAVTGDLIESNHTDVNIAFQFMEDVVQIAPVYYVPGNHEARIQEYEVFRDQLESIGAIVLEDRAVQIEREGAAINLIGLSDPTFEHVRGEETHAMVRAKLNILTDTENMFAILLSHRPELFESYVESRIDLVLSGHAHGGQFRLPFVGGLIAPNQGLFPKYDAGLYVEGDTNMVVSRGIGNSIIPIRFNNRPEVVLVDLKKGA